VSRDRVDLRPSVSHPALLSPVAVAVVAVAAGFTVEAGIGFGATLVMLSLGSLVMPTEAVLFRVVPLNVVLSAVIVLRGRRAVDVRALFARILPIMLLGMPVGVFALRVLPSRGLTLVFAAFVSVLAIAELRAMVPRRGSPAPGAARPPRPLGRGAGLLLLFLGGVAHGALATGGPPVVYVCARTLPDKAVFRATLSALWLILNVALVVVYAAEGDVTVATLRDSAPLIPGLVCGIAAGEVLHGRVSERGFRLVVFALLLVLAVVIGVRAM